MEGTHTVLCLHKQIEEFIYISPYFPTRGVQSFTRSGRTSYYYHPLYTNQHDQKTEDSATLKQRSQSYKPASEVLQSCEATKVLAWPSWLSAEHCHLLVDLLSLCEDCASRFRMGNQDGKVQDQFEGHEKNLFQDVSSSNLQHTFSLSPEDKRSACHVRKIKKLGSKKMDTAEEFLQTKLKKKAQSIKASEFFTNHLDADLIQSTDNQKLPKNPAFMHVPHTPSSDSYVSSEPLLPMEEVFQTCQEAWDFMEDSRLFESEINLCTELTEFEDQFCLTYGAFSCSLTEARQYHTYQEQMTNGNNIGSGKVNSTGKCNLQNKFGDKTVASLHDDTNRRDIVKDVTEGMELTYTPHTASEAQCSTVKQNTYQHLPQVKLKVPNITQESNVNLKFRHRSSEAMTFQLMESQNGTSNFRPRNKSPVSDSLSGIFNVSYPSSNSLQSMSPVLSPLSSKLSSPQLNHRIVLLPEEDGGRDKYQDRSFHETAESLLKASDRPKNPTEAIDKNGNHKTITGLDLNLSQLGSGDATEIIDNTTTFKITGECRVLFTYLPSGILEKNTVCYNI